MTLRAFSRSITSRPNGDEAGALGRHRAVADLVGAIVGELDDAHAEIGEDVDPVDVGRHHRRVLEAVDDADPVQAPGADDVGDIQDLDEVVGAAADSRLPARDLAHGLLERLFLAGDIADGDVDRGQAGRARVGNDPVGEGTPAFPVLLLFAVIGIGEPAERIDDDRHAFAGRLGRGDGGEQGAGAGHAKEQAAVEGEGVIRHRGSHGN